MGTFRYAPMEPDAYLAVVVLGIIEREPLRYVPQEGAGSWDRLRGLALSELAAVAPDAESKRRLLAWSTGAQAGGRSKALLAATPILAAVGEWHRMAVLEDYAALGGPLPGE